MPGDLPPVGARVRTTWGHAGRIVRRSRWRQAGLIYYDAGGHEWVTADEIAEVLDAG